MGPEKLDNTVYWIRGLYDLADMAQSKGDGATERWARSKADGLRERFEGAWWMPEVGPARRLARREQREDPAEALDHRHADGGGADDRPPRGSGPGDARPRDRVAGAARDPVLQRRAAVQPRPVPHGLRRRADRRGREDDLLAEHVDPGRRRGQLRPPRRRAAEALHGRQRRDACSASPPPAASPTSSRARCRRSCRRRTSAENIDRCWTCRAMFMQAWGNYGTAWPVVHQQLGVRPDMGRGALEVVPQLPSASPIAGSNIRLGTGALKGVQASKDGARYTTTVDTGSAPVRSLDARRDAAAHRQGRVGHARRQEGRLAAAHDQPRPRDHDQDRLRPPHGRGHGPLEGGTTSRRVRGSARRPPRRRGAGAAGGSPRSPTQRRCRSPRAHPTRCAAPTSRPRSTPAPGSRAARRAPSPSTSTA